MEKRAETDDLYAERNLLNTRLSALESKIAAAESRERSLQARFARNNDDLLTALNDLVALANLLRNEEQKCKKLVTDHRIAIKGLQEREFKLKKSYVDLATLREKLEHEVQCKLDIRAEKQKADKKLVTLRVRHDAVIRENSEYHRQLKLTSDHLALQQINAATAAKILEEIAKRRLCLPIPAKRSRFFAAFPRGATQRWQELCQSLAEEGIFDPKSYLTLNSDVAESGLDPLVHFLTRGLAENRALKKDADL